MVQDPLSGEVERSKEQTEDTDDALPKEVEEVEDSLDLEDVYECEQGEGRAEEPKVHGEDQPSRLPETKQKKSKGQKQSRSKRRKEEQSPDPLEPERKRRRLVEEIAELSREIRSIRERPQRIIAYITEIREEGRFLRCSFCNRKGLHYSDNCPVVSTVRGRSKRVWCCNCLDNLHSTDRCWRKRTMCKYCCSWKHHCALCESPERAVRMEARLRSLQQELEKMERRYGGPPS